jgi:hypothetical protein
MSDAAFEIVNAFVAVPKKERLLTLLGTKKGRAKVRAALAHFRDLDPRYAQRLGPDQRTRGAIVTLLRERGAPANCYRIFVRTDAPPGEASAISLHHCAAGKLRR